MNKFLQILNFEVRRNFLMMTIWSIVWALMSILIIATFDGIAENSEELKALYDAFPPEVLEAFAIDANDPTSFEVYFNSQLLVLYLLSSAILAVYLGVSKIAKEISNKSLIFLLSKPISRTIILISKAKAILINLFLSNVAIYLISIVSFSFLIKTIDEVPYRFFALTFVAVMIFQILFVSLGIFLSTMFEEGKALGIGVLISIVAFFINFFISLKGVPKFVKYLTPFTYVDLQKISSSLELNIYLALAMLFLSIALFLLSIAKFQSKNIDI